MKNTVIYVHGKGGTAAEADHYRRLFPGSEVIGFDYRAQTPWEAAAEFPPFFAARRGGSGMSFQSEFTDEQGEHTAVYRLDRAKWLALAGRG